MEAGHEGEDPPASEGGLGDMKITTLSASLTIGGFSEIWCNFFKFNFFNDDFFVETSLGYLGTSPGPIEMVS